MQGGRGGKPPIGVIYNTSMSRPDAALALDALYQFEGRREARVGSVCVVGAGLDAAIYCDIVSRFYTPGPPPDANKALPVGLAAENPLPPDPPMVQSPVNRKNQTGDPQYPRSIRKLTDTAMAEAVLRNAVTFNAETAMVLSAPATYLAKSLDLLGVKELYKDRVKRLVIVDSGAPRKDDVALRKILNEWPTPIIFCGKEVGNALAYPGGSIEKDFAWSPAHPIVDAYRGFQSMPYDAPSYDLAAVHYAVHPDSGFFEVSAPGTLTEGDDGRMKFSLGSGKIRSLIVEQAKRGQILQAFVEITSAKPVAPQRGRPPA
jgi:hypothetical protein